ncbi:chemotaxis protein CheW [Paenibacillus sp. sgz500958]|uniref:chemotaxis protein CheW n=1 Tax=Paenibacillus sp. sgz500958 TaxID=3242475 RepID=UPI0036D2F856
MAGRSGKKEQGNFEKMKREMAVKKQKAEMQQNSEISQTDTVTMVLNPEPIVNRTQQIGLVVFKVAEEEFAFRISHVKEIIRVPSMTNIPHAANHIIGMCSLRGELLPVMDSRQLFGLPAQELNENSRIIVADIHGKMIGLVSDKVSEVINIEETMIKEPPANIRGIVGGALNGIVGGIVILNRGKRMVMILDAERITNVGNHDLTVMQQHANSRELSRSEMQKLEEEQLVIFNIGTAEYAFNINNVKEIIRVPEFSKVPNAASHIEGVFSTRMQLLAVINLRNLLGIDNKGLDDSSRVVIINDGSQSYGVLVDKVLHVIGVQKKFFEADNLIARLSHTDFIKGMYTLDNGKRIVMMLEPSRLVRPEEVKASSDAYHKYDPLLNPDEADHNLEHVVIFRLGKEEYAIETQNVQEIRVINEWTHFPGAPVFISGMVDLRGETIPLLNLRQLFAVQGSATHSSKLLVVEFKNKRVGILIDSVSEVLKFPKTNLEEAPAVFKEMALNNHIDKIANLSEGTRIVLLLNLASVLSFM